MNLRSIAIILLIFSFIACNEQSKYEPGSEVVLKSFQPGELHRPLKIKSIQLLKHEENLKWEIIHEGLRITIPQSPMDSRAVVF